MTPAIDSLPRTATEHFKLAFYGAVAELRRRLPSDAVERFPFLAGYFAELDASGVEPAHWAAALHTWEDGASGRLPVAALRQAYSLDDVAIALLFTAGLTEEDARFGHLFETLHGLPGEHRPTVGVLGGWWADTGDRDAVRRALRRLQQLGVLESPAPDAPRPDRPLQVPAVLWDALRGDAPAADGWRRYTPANELPDLDELILPRATAERVAAAPALLADGDAATLVLRGPRASGRRTVVGAIARRLGRGLLELEQPGPDDGARWRQAGILATVLDAVPVIELDLGPTETYELPRPQGYAGPLALALGHQGGLAGAGAEQAISIVLRMPDAGARRRHWAAALGDDGTHDVDALAEAFRLTGGTIRRAAGIAHAEAALAGRTMVGVDDARLAARALNAETLDTLAERVPTLGGWSDLALGEETVDELTLLEARCRYRERLDEAVGATLGRQLNPGVRALFTGASGTGKTLAARVLASALGKDLYRLDLSSVVDKYIGETEKNLSAIFDRAEELDVILLLDEGDALLTRRTDVHTSNDRYANLETNYLLQRLESFEGILIVTTNAGERIDAAFERRMDVVVEFHAPDAAERAWIWQLHLPPLHAVDSPYLEEVAGRCALTGGQIRNAVLHAALLAVTDGGTIGPAQLAEAVQREYRKAGAVCPLRSDG
jgi:hypothetical protein